MKNKKLGFNYNWKYPEIINSNDFIENNLINSFQKQILYHRGFKSNEQIKNFFNFKIEYSSLFKDFDKTIQRISNSIKQKEIIFIYGDYDADGITSTALLYQFFQLYFYLNNKKQKLLYIIFPQRIRDGYGLRKETVLKAKALKTNLLITLDNGITSYEPVNLANNYGIDVIIIDHHHLPEKIPKAYAIINPHQSSCKYPYKGFATVGLVYKLVLALTEKFFKKNIQISFKERYKDLVGIGTYQDLAPLYGENRYFVKNALKIIKELFKKEKKTNVQGLIQLLKLRDYNSFNNIDYDTLGFYIGPILNSAGRIGDSYKAFDLLTTTNKNHAKKLAIELKSLNDRRRELTYNAFLEASKIIKTLKLNDNNIIILKSNTWHEGIIGLIAQKITNTYSKSSIVMSNANNSHYTGSARAYGKNLNIGKLITDLKEYLINCGGHSKAAGFSVSEEKVNLFTQKIQKIVQNNKKEIETLQIDAIITLKELNNSMKKNLELLEPFGEINPKIIVLIKNLTIYNLKISKRKIDTLIQVGLEYPIIQLVSFNNTIYLKKLKIGQKINIICELSISKDKINTKLIDLNLY